VHVLLSGDIGLSGASGANTSHHDDGAAMLFQVVVGVIWDGSLCLCCIFSAVIERFCDLTLLGAAHDDCLYCNWY
jgi:hypothetical protein